MNCVWCGGEVINRNSIYCGDKCKWARMRAKKKQALLDNPKKICEWCNGPITRTQRDKRHGENANRFCSRGCFNKNQANKLPACQVCGRHHKGNEGELCSECKRKADVLARSKKTCVICGKEFVLKQRNTCSEECQKIKACIQSRTSAEKKHSKNVKAHKCKWCGKEFIPEYGTKRRCFCSTECADIASQDLKHAYQRTRNNKEMVKTADGRHYNPISLRRLWLRDSGICQICGKIVDWSLPRTGRYGPHAMSATRDHIIPVSCGGTHTWDNVRLAHFMCNCKRGTGGNAQLLLLG